MARSNTANGGNTFIDVFIQVVSTNSTHYRLRAVVYLTSLNVVDSTNNLSIVGNTGGLWSRSGALALNGTYSNTPVWFQDIDVARPATGTLWINFSATWSSVEYWGQTLSATSETFGVPAYVPPASAPNPPTALTVYNITSSSAHVAVSGAGAENGSTAIECEFHVYSGGPAGGGGTHIRTIGGLNQGIGYAGGVVSGLTRATAYWLYARTRNAIGWSSWAGPHGFTTAPVVPKMGTTHYATSITRNSAVITGLSVTDTGGAALTDASVEWNTSPSSTGSQSKSRGSWGDITITGLTAGTTYHYRVRARNSAGWSAVLTTWKTFTTLLDAPSDMAPPTLSAAGNTSLTVTWVAPNMNGATFTNYRYELSTSPTFASLLQSGTTTSTSRTFPSLTPGTTYYVRVRANATPNNGGWGTMSASTTGRAPNAGLRVFLAVGTTVHEGTLYTFVNGQRKEVRPMWMNGTTMETE